MSNWILQGNPKRYPVIEVLERGIAIDNWSVTHSFEDMGKGDRAALWVSGSGGGVIALGQVDGPVGEGYADGDWLDPAERGMPATFCPLRFDRLSGRRPSREQPWSRTTTLRRPDHPSAFRRQSVPDHQ